MRHLKSFNIPTIIKSIQIMGKRNIPYLVSIFLFCSIELAGIPLLTYGIKGVINAVTMKSYSLFWKSIILIALKHLIWSIYSPISSYLCSYASNGAIRDVKVNITEHIIKLPQKYHDSKTNGEILSHISNDTSCLEGIYDYSFFEVIRHALQGIGGIVIMALIDWRFAIVVFMLGTISVYATAHFSKKLEVTGEKLQEDLAKTTVDAYELIKAVKTIRLLNLSDSKKHQFDDSTEAEAITRVKSGEISWKMKAVITGLAAATYLLIIAIGATFVYYNLSDWGTVIALTGLKSSTDCLFLECGEHMAGMQTNVAGVKRLLAILDEKEETILENGKFIITKDSIPLSTTNINFSYDEKSPVLEDINICIEPCKLTALIGESGCGKSSLMKLLLALYEPDKGSISFKGNEVVTFEALRSKTAYVPQEPMLFSGTVFENISFGYENASINEVISAAKAASVDEFIQLLPNGYDTMIFEEGKNLSGGEKQRIAIARALLKNTPILLLDEITSALDNTTEEKIMETILNISKSKAVFIITHNPDIGIYADRVYDFNDISEEKSTIF
ncbi:MAG: ABC transporter ATP-binding protein [Clostridium sp.]|uniref:ABC transporter ATP-binding protein n=1 Tax=Clostridium sp. TaxID=1506 RepID=UPI003D6D6A98